MLEQSLASVTASGTDSQNATSLLSRIFLFTYKRFTLVATFILLSVVCYQLLFKVTVSHACKCDYYSLLHAALYLDKLEDINI